MPPAEASTLKQAILEADFYLEYGMGGSTVFARENGVSIIAVENVHRWCRRISRQTRRLPGQHHLVYVDTGPTKSWGRPRDQSGAQRYGDYTTRPWEIAEGLSVHPDTVLIDGRWRVACFLVSLLCARANTIILFDDYVGRNYCDVVETFLQPIALHGRMARFEVPSQFPRLQVEAAHQRSLIDSE